MDKSLISFLILDYDRPVESEKCLLSIKEHAQFKHQVIYLSNGGTQDYVLEFYKKGLIDKLILNKKNNGCGFGTLELFRLCDTEYAFYVQCDQFMVHTLKDEHIDVFKRILKEPSVKAVDLNGGLSRGIYCERAHFISVPFYNSIPDKPGGGPGPFEHVEWNEGYVLNYFKENNYQSLVMSPLLFMDNGKYTIRNNFDGSIWKIRTDTKEVWMIKPPTEKYRVPNFTDAEWDEVIKNQHWPPGKIPEKDRPYSFRCYD
jgi:hypothetical protein